MAHGLSLVLRGKRPSRLVQSLSVGLHFDRISEHLSRLMRRMENPNMPKRTRDFARLAKLRKRVGA